MEKVRRRSRDRTSGFKAALFVAAFLSNAGQYTNAGVVTTVDPGAVGSTLPNFTATVTLTDPTIDSVEIFFEDMKFIEVIDDPLYFAMVQFGSPPEGGNSRSTFSWGFLGESGDPIFTTSDCCVIATAHHSRGTDIAGSFRVYGFFATWDPPVFVQPGTSQVQFEFLTDVVVRAGAGANPVNMDIKPGNKHNKLNPRSRGTIWVAILSDIGPESPFDPLSQVDISTVGFGPDAAKVIRDKTRDINRDGVNDLLLLFKIRETGIACGETEAILTGETFDAQQFSGTDLIHTIGCRRP